jgi:hypothetical protein
LALAVLAAAACACAVSATVSGAESTAGRPVAAAPLRHCFVADWRRAESVGEVTPESAHPFSVLLEHSSDRLQVISIPPRGQRVLQVDLEPGDHDPNGTSQRTELAAPQAHYGPGADIWLATSFYLPQDFPIPGRLQWAVISQLFGRSGGQSTGSPPIALEVTSAGQFALAVRGGSKGSYSDEAPREHEYPLGRISLSTWHDFLLHIRLAKDSTGAVQAWHWVEGTRIPARPRARDTGVNVLTVDGVTQDVFPEVGYYRSSDTRPGTLYTIGLAVCPDESQAERFLSG